MPLLGDSLSVDRDGSMDAVDDAVRAADPEAAERDSLGDTEAFESLSD
jgi:hypothetical protein